MIFKQKFGTQLGRSLQKKNPVGTEKNFFKTISGLVSGKEIVPFASSDYKQRQKKNTSTYLFYNHRCNLITRLPCDFGLH